QSVEGRKLADDQGAEADQQQDEAAPVARWQRTLLAQVMPGEQQRHEGNDIAVPVFCPVPVVQKRREARRIDVDEPRQNDHSDHAQEPRTAEKGGRRGDIGDAGCCRRGYRAARDAGEIGHLAAPSPRRPASKKLPIGGLTSATGAVWRRRSRDSWRLLPSL